MKKYALVSKEHSIRRFYAIELSKDQKDPTPMEQIETMDESELAKHFVGAADFGNYFRQFGKFESEKEAKAILFERISQQPGVQILPDDFDKNKPTISKLLEQTEKEIRSESDASNMVLSDRCDSDD